MHAAEELARKLAPIRTDIACLHFWIASGLEKEAEQLAAHGFGEWAGLEEGFVPDEFDRLIAKFDRFIALKALRAVTELRCTGVRPAVFLSTPLPPAQTASTKSSVTRRHSSRPGTCEEWAEVQLRWLCSSFPGTTASSQLGAGGGLAGSGSNTGSGPDSNGEAGRRYQPLEVISSLPGHADRVFSDANGVPYRLRTDTTPPGILYNEATTSSQILFDVLRPLGTLVNSWLATQRSSGGGSSSSGSAAAGELGLSAPAGAGPSGAGAGLGAGPPSGGPAGAAAASAVPAASAAAVAPAAAAAPAATGSGCRMVLRIGRPILGSAQQPDATFKAATLFMMLCGIEFANTNSMAAAAQPGAVRKSGSGLGSGRRVAGGGDDAAGAGAGGGSNSSSGGL
ncbi:hypothetical protein HXX76_010918 [Chlamydomonas incerta]|uniref:Uncharacterized protein n=1 Tax=Chlamydomonas incerta TaxID=51695 RepID=A0A835SUU6_CHLIN|nr:hypothetical protein HXX76_010918 [Chlamydomonas incerta]|eukprot:KAG2427200.1 hypothetical protein HXX76_010918 [Chlamydomonas incerta]